MLLVGKGKTGKKLSRKEENSAEEREHQGVSLARITDFLPREIK